MIRHIKKIRVFLKTQVHSNVSSVNIKYFNKLFNVDNMQPLDGFNHDKNNVVIAEKNNNNTLELININDLTQIDGMKTL